MSWLTKVAGRAEQLLNQIDQNAAVALKNNSKKGSGRSDSAVSLIDDEKQELLKPDKPRSEVIETLAKPDARSSHTHSVSSRVRGQRDEDLIAYLNDSNGQTSSRCSSAASCFSAPNPQGSNAFVPRSESFATSEGLRAQHLDTIKCLHMKESQIAVMCVRLQEAEEANIKKDAQIAELDREIKMSKKLDAGNGNIGDEQFSKLKKLQRERDREKEEFEKREQEYVRRLESANNENSTIKKELQELRTKILQMEMNERSLTEEIRLAKYNLEANKHEFDEYKQRAQKILSAKENLLTSLRENSLTGSDISGNNIEIEELRCERDLLKEDLQQSQFVIYNLKGDIQEMENRLRDEQRSSGAQRENLTKEMHHHLSQANHYREQMERSQLEYEFLQAEMRRQEEAVERKLAEKDVEMAKLMEEKKTSRRYEVGEMEQKISLLSEKLIAKQTAIERLESEKRALELRLERSERAYKNAEAAAVKSVAVDMRENVYDQNSSLFMLSSSDNLPVHFSKLVFSIFDHLGLRIAVFMRSPVFRFFFLMYCLLLHTWVFFILFTYSPEKMTSVAEIPQSLRPIAHYVKIGAENASYDPIVHYWCFYYAVQTGMNMDKESPEALKYLTSLLTVLEDMKKKLKGQDALTQDMVAQAHVENFALKLFEYADKNDRQSNFTKGVIKAFYMAGHLIDVLTLFGQLDDNLVATRKYAKWKAAYLHNCLKNGETPKPGSTSNQEVDPEDLNSKIRQSSDSGEKFSQSVDESMQPHFLSSSGATDFRTASGENPQKPFVPPRVFPEILPETGVTSEIGKSNSLQPDASHNGGSEALTITDYLEAQKYAKYAVSALSYEDSKTAIESMMKALSILKKTKECSKKTVFGKKSKRKKKKQEDSAGVVPAVSAFTGEYGIFGVPLSLAVLRMGCHDHIPLPVIVRQCIDYINEKGLCVEGIHRISAPKGNLDRLEDAVNRRKFIVLEDVHDASGLLKRFLRQLPEHILTNEKRAMFEKIAGNCPCGTLSPCHCLVADMLKARLSTLPAENYMLLAYVFIHAQMILQNSDKNKMGLAALGLILQASMNISQSLVRIFLLNASDFVRMNYHSPSMVYLFSDVQIKR
ncbi:unnamed protein product [Thelazia callipaeda]|uniref:Rho-GAP domain-containing protein n=1 Tax=Thelazia callipaeda TaxID=103827 RepID=A0A0N5CK70_THECL|nr:unnamed protein product [Thelazia callipaeda]